MEVLTTRSGARGSRQRSARRQRGDILLVVMVFLLVSLLGLVVSMRQNIVSTLMGGNNLQRQRNVQVSDVAMRQVESLINTAAAGQTLEVTAFTQPWMRIVAGGTASPTATSSTYWDSCLGNSDNTLRCGTLTPTVNGTALGYTALVVVQPTGRYDLNACQLNGIGKGSNLTATYYDVFVHIKEANGVTSNNIEMVYRLCTP
jgi:Tfp pilus assembly protein PilX